MEHATTKNTGAVYFLENKSAIVSNGEFRARLVSCALAESNVDASAAVSAHRTFCFLPVAAVLVVEDVVLLAAMAAFSSANRSLRLAYWLDTSSINRGVEREVVVSDVASDFWDFDMARDGRLRLELFIALEALEAADDMVIILFMFHCSIVFYSVLPTSRLYRCIHLPPSESKP